MEGEDVNLRDIRDAMIFVHLLVLAVMVLLGGIALAFTDWRWLELIPLSLCLIGGLTVCAHNRAEYGGWFKTDYE